MNLATSQVVTPVTAPLNRERFRVNRVALVVYRGTVTVVFRSSKSVRGRAGGESLRRESFLHPGPSLSPSLSLSLSVSTGALPGLRAPGLRGSARRESRARCRTLRPLIKGQRTIPCVTPAIAKSRYDLE
eukprot:760304-Hanusia_phi.AAC.2